MALTDEEMINIAEEMNEMYCNNGYHEDLDTAYNKIKNNK